MERSARRGGLHRRPRPWSTAVRPLSGTGAYPRPPGGLCHPGTGLAASCAGRLGSRPPILVPGRPSRALAFHRKVTVIKINAITVPADSGDELARRFAARAGAVDDQEGFEGFELLKPTDDQDHVAGAHAMAAGLRSSPGCARLPSPTDTAPRPSVPANSPPRRWGSTASCRPTRSRAVPAASYLGAGWSEPAGCPPKGGRWRNGASRTQNRTRATPAELRMYQGQGPRTVNSEAVAGTAARNM